MLLRPVIDIFIFHIQFIATENRNIPYPKLHTHFFPSNLGTTVLLKMFRGDPLGLHISYIRQCIISCEIHWRSIQSSPCTFNYMLLGVTQTTTELYVNENNVFNQRTMNMYCSRYSIQHWHLSRLSVLHFIRFLVMYSFLPPIIIYQFTCIGSSSNYN